MKSKFYHYTAIAYVIIAPTLAIISGFYPAHSTTLLIIACVVTLVEALVLLTQPFGK